MLPTALVFVVLCFLVGLVLAHRAWRARALHIWYAGYRRSQVRNTAAQRQADEIHVMFCLADHWEPAWRQAHITLQRQRVAWWVDKYPKLMARFRDSDGQPPRHSFFYPLEQYVPEHLDRLAELCRQGWGEVEVHLHHEGETADQLRQILEQGKCQLANHGCLARERDDPAIRYAFIHGNWALDNAWPDGRACGCNRELRILRDTGCYADLTLPSAPTPTQTSKVNSIYYATDHPRRPKSHDTGVDLAVGRQPSGDLLLVQGPLGLDWSRKKFGFLPRIENSDLSGDNPPTPRRADCWIRQHIHVSGRPEWVFVKVHTHGCFEPNLEALLGGPAEQLHEHLTTAYNDGRRYHLHYVTAREMVNIIKAAEAGQTGNPGEYRDYRMVSLLS